MLKRPLVGIVGDSPEVFATLAHTAETLDELSVPYERVPLSAHYHPDGLRDYAKGAAGRGLEVLVAGEKGAAHIAGMLEAFADKIQVLAVLITTEELRGLDSVASVLGMPAKVPVAIMGFDKPGAINAGIFAAKKFTTTHPQIAAALDAFHERARQASLAANERLQQM